MKRCKTKDTVLIRVHKDLLKQINLYHKQMGKSKYSRTYITKIGKITVGGNK